VKGRDKWDRLDTWREGTSGAEVGKDEWERRREGTYRSEGGKG